MNQLGVEVPRRTRDTPENPAEALGAVVENATALARAELRLAATEARAWLVRATLGLIGLWLSLLLFQTLALLIALAPVIATRVSLARLGITLALAGLPLVACSIFAARELRQLKERGHAK